MVSRFRLLACTALLSAAPALSLAAATLDPAAMTQVAGRGAPIKVGGLWCGAGLLRDFTLDIAQHFDLIEARLVRKGRVRQITGRIEGSTLRADPQRDHTMELQALGNELRITAGTGVLALARGQSFTRASGGSCTH
jgi:hypothetical protein